MKNCREKRINVFFVEIIIVIFFLMIASTILASIYARANYEINNSKLLSEIVIDANSIAEIYSDKQDLNICIKQVYGEKSILERADNKYRLCLDNGISLEIVERFKESDAGVLKKIYLEYKKGNSIFFDLDSSSYKRK